jgi:hypothetical protein
MKSAIHTVNTKTQKTAKAHHPCQAARVSDKAMIKLLRDRLMTRSR